MALSRRQREQVASSASPTRVVLPRRSNAPSSLPPQLDGAEMQPARPPQPADPSVGRRDTRADLETSPAPVGNDDETTTDGHADGDLDVESDIGKTRAPP